MEETKLAKEERLYENSFCSILFHIKQNQVKMLNTRGFAIDEDERGYVDGSMNIEQFVARCQKKAGQTGYFTDTLTRLYHHKTEDKYVLVFYLPLRERKSKRSSKVISQVNNHFIQFYERFQQDNESIITSTTIMIVTEHPYDTNTLGALRYTISRAANLQIFLHDELGYNPLDHFLVPKHTLLNEEEKDQLLFSRRVVDREGVPTETYYQKMSLEQLPQISIHDPIAKYYNAQVGDVFRIDRKNINPYSDTLVTETVAYRVVVNTQLRRGGKK